MTLITAHTITTSACPSERQPWMPVQFILCGDLFKGLVHSVNRGLGTHEKNDAGLSVKLKTKSIENKQHLNNQQTEKHSK